MFLSLGFLIIGLALITKGADFFVDGAAALAKRFKIPEIIVGLTIVAMGTSAPEAGVSIMSAIKGAEGVAIGNIIGSNIANILLIGGLGAVCKGTLGLPFSTEGLISGIVAFVAAVIIFASSFGKKKCLGRAAGIIMLSCLIAYYIFIFLNLYVFNIY